MAHIFWLGLALAASPGPDFFLILRHTLSGGRSLGYATLLGNRISLILHISFAIFGISIAIRHSASLYLTIRFLGALYLIYLGTRNLVIRFRGNSNETVNASADWIPTPTAIKRGFFNNLLNPKVSLFFLSFFPQFVTTETLAESPWTVAAIFFLGNTSWWIPLIFVVGNPVLRKSLYRFQYWLDVLFGFVFIWFGVRIFFQEIP